MKIETAIERLNLMIARCESRYEIFGDAPPDYGDKTAQELIYNTELDIETLRMAVRALEEKPRWIPCAERMPEMHEFTYCTDNDIVKSSGVVLFCDHESVHTGYYESAEDTVGVRARWYTEDGEPCDGVTAWMPLPEAYKED